LSPVFNNPDGNVLNFSVSPDRQQVAYIADADAEDTPGLFLVSASGGAATQIDPGFGTGFRLTSITWAPDGSQVAFLVDPAGPVRTEVYTADRASSRKVSGSVGSPPVVYLGNIAWSPDSRYLAQLVFDLKTGRPIGINTYDSAIGSANSSRVTPGVDLAAGETVERDFAWSPASDRIFYRSGHEGDNRIHLYSSAADGSDTLRVSSLSAANGETRNFAVSPDGQYVAFNADSNADGTYDLTVADIDGANPATLTQNREPYRPAVFEWSPDSDRISFSSDELMAGVNDSYVADINGANKVKLNRDLGAGQKSRLPGWSPDGRKILYSSDEEQARRFEIYVADRNGRNRRQVTGLHAGNDIGAILWSPDSSRIAYTARHRDGQIDLLASTANGLSTTVVNAPNAAGEEIYWSGFRWSDDSSRIAFIDYVVDIPVRMESLDLWIGTPNGDAPLRLNREFDFEWFYIY
jgi:Tol biopolymer transport system component